MAGEWIRDTQTLLEAATETTASALRETQTLLEAATETNASSFRVSQVVLEVATTVGGQPGYPPDYW